MSTDLMFNTGVLSFSIFTNQHSVDVVVRSLEALDGHAGPDIGEKIESTTKSEIERDVTFPNYALMMSVEPQ
jgi:hypothetical protein